MTSTPSEKSARSSHDIGDGGIGLLSPTRALLLFAATGAIVAVLGAANPIVAAQDWILGNGENMRAQPTHLAGSFDTAFGEDLRNSLETRSESSAQLVLVIGNSQQFTSSLPRGAAVAPNHEVTVAADQFAAALDARAPGRFALYDAAAPNQNFVEALWQGIYWFKVSRRPPAVLILQASFDTFRKTGVRAGFQTLLTDPAFVRALGDYTADAGARAYAEQFATARRDFSDRQKALATSQSSRPSVEELLRRSVDYIPLYQRREELRGDLLNVLYEARVDILKISPTTRRHIAGVPAAANFQALADLSRMAAAAGAKVLIYNAPINPLVDMFYADEYQDYLHRLTDLVAQIPGAMFADLADAVPEQDWGYWLDGPDPIHFGENGHRIVGARLDRAFGPALSRLDKE